MANVLIVAYLLIVLALIGVILLQRSEGGGLGMGSSSNGLMTVRGSANLLTRTTAVLAALFFATAIGLTILSEVDNRTSGILQGAADSATSDVGAPTSVLDALNALEGDDSLNVPAAPATDATPTTPGADPALSVPAAPSTDAAPAATDAAPAAESTTAPAAPATPAAPAASDTTTPAPSDTSSPAATGTQTPAAPVN
ncbi:MAG TPA: preprotein translocase subunit SecG [Devosia sp.]